MYKGKSVGVVVPAYNEAGFVGQVIDTMPALVDRVYLVDDGSADGTWQEIQEHVDAAQDEPEDDRFDERFVPIRHGHNRGAGAALKTGYIRARDEEIDVTAVMAGDAQMDPDILDEIIDPVATGDVDYTKGNRLSSPALREAMPRVRFIGSSVLTFLTKVASGYWKMMDPQNGYTAISLRALQLIDLDGLYDGFGTPNELLVRLNVYNMRIADVPMPANYGDEESHIRYSTYIRKMSRMLLRDFLWRMKTKYLVLDFHPLVFFYLFGVMGVVSGGVSAVYSLWIEFISPTAVSLGVRGVLSLLLFMTGSMFLMFAMLFDMQANEHLEVRIYE